MDALHKAVDFILEHIEKTAHGPYAPSRAAQLRKALNEEAANSPRQIRYGIREYFGMKQEERAATIEEAAQALDFAKANTVIRVEALPEIAINRGTVWQFNDEHAATSGIAE